jgi:predicted ATP-dependent serine protease
VEQRSPGTASGPVPLQTLQHETGREPRASTGIPGIDRVLGGGLVPATVALLAGEPGIGKSTLLLQLVANLSAAGLPCLLASGEESRDQVALRARRLGISGDRVAFVSGRELGPLVDAARAAGLTKVFCATEPGPMPDGLRAIRVGHVADALEWAGFGARSRAERDRVA